MDWQTLVNLIRGAFTQASNPAGGFMLVFGGPITVLGLALLLRLLGFKVRISKFFSKEPYTEKGVTKHSVAGSKNQRIP